MEVLIDGQPVAIGGPRQRAVLATLLLASGRVVSVETLMEEVWSGKAPSTGRAQIAICVGALRKLFRNAGVEQEVIVTAAPGYRLCADGHVIDAVEFTRRVEDARRLAQMGGQSWAIQLLREALDLWRGPALDGVRSRTAETEAMGFEEQRLLATEHYVALRLECGEHRSLLGDLSALVRENPLRERFRAQLMLAQYRSRQRAQALQTFREGHRQFVEELGLEPGEELQRIHQSILRDDAAELDSAPAVTEPAWPDPAQLPSDTTVFLGRGWECAVLDALVTEQAESRHMASVGFITGAPGVGKTSLAINWAHRVSERFPDGTLFADLQEGGQPLDSGSVLKRFLRGLGVGPQRMPQDIEECAALYRTLLGSKRILIILDNAHSYRQLRPLLPGNGTCCLLVTSCTGLDGFSGNGEVPRLALQPLRAADSVALLRSVVRDARTNDHPDDTAEVAELCGHQPQALRAAGERLVGKPHWTVADLLHRLRDPSRRLDELSRGQQPVRARLESSYQRLGAAEARAYRKLSAISESGFDTATAARMLDLPLLETEDLAESLVDAHLLRAAQESGTLRYRFEDLVLLHARETHLAHRALS